MISPDDTAPLQHLLTAIEVAAMVAFALSGVFEAARKQMDAVGVCVVAGLAAFGGGTLRDVLRDIVCNEIPALLRDHRPYAVCAFAGGWAVVGLTWLGAEPWQAMLAGGAIATALRALAVWTGYTLPRWSAGG